MADRSRRKYTEMADDLFGLKPLQVEPLEEEAEPFAVEPIAPSPAPKAQSVQTLKAPPAQDSAPKQEMNPVVRDYLMKNSAMRGTSRTTP